MRKSRTYLLVVCVLVVALVASLVIGCTPKNQGPSKNGGSFISGSNEDPFEGALEVANADKYMQFDLYADKDQVPSVNVEDLNGNPVSVNVSPLTDGYYKVYAPQGGYQMQQTYLITLGDGVSFVDYPNARKIKFTVTVNTISNVEFKAGTLVLSSELVAEDPVKTAVKEDGTECGKISIQNTGKIELNDGDIFIIKNDLTRLQQAYKVVGTPKSFAGALIVNYEKPNLEEIYNNFTYEGSEVLDEDNKDQLVLKSSEQVEKEIANSAVAQSIAGVFGKVPTINADVKLVGKEVVAIITITVPDMVYGNNGNADLVFVLENRLSAVAETSISNDKIKNSYDVAFDVKADITNVVKFNVGIFAKGSYSRVDNIQGLIDKMQLEKVGTEDAEKVAAQIAEVKAEVENEPLSVPVFKWTLPIANGAASVSYDADLAMNFGFSGQFGVAAQTTLKYDVGASYNQAKGIETYCHPSENNKVCDEVSLKLDGNVNAKVGINQRLSLDVLAGVLGVGLRANVGNFNRLYGYADAAWVATGVKNEYGLYDMAVKEGYEFDGSMYLEGGVYWDVNIDLGVKVGALLHFDALNNVNLNKSFNLSTGEKVLYTGGSKELVRDIEPAILGTGKNGVVTAKKSVVNFNKNIYNIYNKQNEVLPVDASAITVEVAPESKSVVSVGKVADDWMVEVKDVNTTTDFVLTVSYTYKDAFLNERTITKNVTYDFSSDLMLDKNEYSFNKSSDNKANRTMTLTVVSKFGAPVVEINNAQVGSAQLIDTNKYQVTINREEIDVVPNGSYALVVKAGEEEVKANMVIDGIVSAKAVKNDANGYYKIYCADQVADLLASGYTDNFELVKDIDMKGVKLSNGNVFNGTLYGNTHQIYNIEINNENSDDNNALISVNNGTIDKVTFAGQVNVKLSVKSGSKHYVAGVVAVNNGTLNKVNFVGDVKVESVGLKTSSTVYVAAVVANNAGTMTGCDVLSKVEGKSSVVVTYTYDLVGMEYVIGSVTPADAADSNVKLDYNCVSGSKTSGLTKVTIAA